MPKYLVFLTDGPRNTLFEEIPNKYAYNVVSYYRKEFQYAGCNLDYLNNSIIVLTTPQPIKILKTKRSSKYLFDPHGQDKERSFVEHRVIDEGYSCGYLINMLLDDPAIFPYLEEYCPDKYQNDLIPIWLKFHRQDYLMRSSNNKIISNTEGQLVEHFKPKHNVVYYIILIFIIIIIYI